MIEISIKIEQRGDNHVILGLVPKRQNATDSELLYYALMTPMLTDVLFPALEQSIRDVGGQVDIVSGAKAEFMADQMGWLPPVSDEDLKD